MGVFLGVQSGQETHDDRLVRRSSGGSRPRVEGVPEGGDNKGTPFVACGWVVAFWFHRKAERDDGEGWEVEVLQSLRAVWWKVVGGTRR